MVRLFPLKVYFNAMESTIIYKKEDKQNMPFIQITTTHLTNENVWSSPKK